MRRAGVGLLVVAGLGAIVRVGYVLAQRTADPAFGRPTLDGAVYWDWAGRLAAGQGSPDGAYYLAPLYPFLLGGWRALFGDAFVGLYLVQQGMVLASAWLLARVAARSGGPVAAVATAVLVVGYHPLLFFAARPLSEPFSVLLAACAIALATRPEPPGETRWGVASGALAGLAALARPNLLVLAPGWAVLEWIAGRRRRALVILVAAVAVVLPVTVRNTVVSGHVVPVSSNAGLTLFHGNAPGARGGLTAVDGMSGTPSRQRDEATALARVRSGRPLDAVEADRWWGRRAVDARLADPVDSIRLALRRAGLTLADAELGLDAAPSLDGNPWRRGAPVPFALIVGLAAAALAAGGVARSGGREVWAAIAACALAPLVFYVSSRYRLPLAVLFTVPAGCGVAAIVAAWRTRGRRGAALPLATLLVVAGVSLSIPTASLERTQTAAALANRADQKIVAGDLEGAIADADASIAIEPSAIAYFNRGAALRDGGRLVEAEQAWRAALRLDPGHAESAGDLAGSMIHRGAPAAAIPLLRRALDSSPTHEVCWTNLVAALAGSGDAAGARRAAAEARSNGVRIESGLLDLIREDGP